MGNMSKISPRLSRIGRQNDRRRTLGKHGVSLPFETLEVCLQVEDFFVIYTGGLLRDEAEGIKKTHV